MNRQESLDHWKAIIDGYQKDKETVQNYCKRIGVHNRMFYHYRVLIYGPSSKHKPKEKKLLPVVVENPGSTSVKINRIDISYQNASISDSELSRIIRLCRDL